MKILLVSDDPHGLSAYAQQAFALAQVLQDAGHELLYFGVNYRGAPMDYHGVRLVGDVGHWQQAMPDMIGHYAITWQPDVIFTFKDPYAFPPEETRQWPVPWIALAPVDTEPAGLLITQALQYATAIVAITKVGQALLAQQQLQAFYAPLFVDTDFFTPNDSAALSWRLNMDIPPNAFLASVVGLNNDPEDRKNLVQTLLSWRMFIRDHPDAVLYLHTEVSAHAGGHNLEMLLHFLELTERNLRVCDPGLYLQGYPASYLRDVYRASDLLIAIGNEGFCQPVVEAAACGTPSLTVKFAALRETTCAGWMIEQHSGETCWTTRGAMWFRPSRKAILDGLAQAATEGTNTLTEVSREAALRYNKDKVISDYWLPMFAQIEAQLKEAVLA